MIRCVAQPGQALPQSLDLRIAPIGSFQLLPLRTRRFGGPLPAGCDHKAECGLRKYNSISVWTFIRGRLSCVLTASIEDDTRLTPNQIRNISSRLGIDVSEFGFHLG